MNKRWHKPVLAAIAGGCAVFSFAPFGWWPLLPASLALIFWLISTAASTRQAAVLGWVYGTSYFFATIHWLYIALHTFGGMPAAIAALTIAAFCAFLGLYPALTAACAFRLVPVRQRAASLWLALPTCWALMDWVRGWLFTGFPWVSTGYSQIPDAPLAGYAPLIGIYGLGWLLALTAGGIVWLIGDWQHTGGKRRQAGAALALLALWLGGDRLLDRQWTLPDGAPLKVNLLQGNITQDIKWEASAVVPTLRRYYEMTEDAEQDVDLIVLPETAFPLFLHEIPADYLSALTEAARSKGAALLIGAPLLGQDQRSYFNAAVMLTDPHQPSYNKSHLVPFGEYVPLQTVFGWVYQSLLNMPLSGFTPGHPQQPPFQIKQQRIAAHICYEDVFGEELITNARNASILLNLSNLAWYDPSIAPAQHGQIAQARAMETGRTILRATNSGTTAIINPRGHYLGKLPERKVATLSGKAQGYRGDTPYLRWGNQPFLLLCGISLLVAAWLRYSRR